MLKIIQVETDKHKHHVSELFLEHLNLTNLIFKTEYNTNLDVNTSLEQYVAQLPEFMPPEGRLLLGKYKGKIVGCACLRKIDQGVGEVKIMYVKPKFHSKGIGRYLLENIIYEAPNIGYSKLRLDIPPFAKESVALYRSLGFQDTEPYLENTDIPPEYRANWIFMELNLL